MTFYVKKCDWCQAENHPSEIACVQCEHDLPDEKIESENEPIRRQNPTPKVSRATPPAPEKEFSLPEVIHRLPPVTAPESPPRPEPIAVIVTDINMPFLSMVSFMVKWVIAAVPALIFLAFLALIVSTIIRVWTI